jgi:primary-amine oxidase
MSSYRRTIVGCLVFLFLSSAAAAHPLDALSATEIRSTTEILRGSDLVDAEAKFATLTLQENEKSEVRAWQPGTSHERRAFVVVVQGDQVFEAIVDIGNRSIESWVEVSGVQPRVMLHETMINELLWESADWLNAMQRRGYDEDAAIFCAPLTPGPAVPDEFADRRILYSSCFDINDEDAMFFGQPIEGLMAVVDVRNREVLSVVDLGAVPLPPLSPGLRYEDSPQYRMPARPVEITTPQGSNIEISGSMIHWDNWSFHLRVDQRVGPVVSLVTYDDQGTSRDILYQLAVSEMFVPYMDPAETWSWKAYMDVGEYGFGLLASRLKPGADCPASARLLDQTIADDDGNPLVLGNSVCIFERATGDPLWRHVGEDADESVANVELVVRMAPVVGNYDYIIDYVFNRAGDIEVRAGAAGIDAVKAVAAQSMANESAAEDTAYGTLISPGRVGINHDHYISFRIDMDVDGAGNRAVFDEVTPQRLARRTDRRSIWTVSPRTIETEGPLAHTIADGYLRIESTGRVNGLGNPTSYQLYPGHTTTSVLAATDPLQSRAGWSHNPVWLSRFSPDQLYASGRYPNQNGDIDGLMKWTEAERSIDGEDLVLWYNVGFRHITRAEDWPGMPTVWHSFRLRPFNFFDQSPAMDVPR